MGDGSPSFPEKTDIWVDAFTSASTAGVSIISTGWFVAN
jgi:hypothetical protein